MYVVATCGVFVVGVEFNADYLAFSDIDGIKQEFIPHCKKLFCSLGPEGEDSIKVESVSDTDPVVTALTFMDKFTDAAYNVIRKQMITALKGCIVNVYTKVYEREMQRKVEALRTQLFD